MCNNNSRGYCLCIGVQKIVSISLCLLLLFSICADAEYIPSSAYYAPSNGERVLNIRNAPFHAVGNGVKDDTEAFIRAYDFVLRKIDKVGWKGAFPASNSSSYIIYIPNGTYLVSDTIIYSGIPRWRNIRKNLFLLNNVRPRGFSEAVVWIRLEGESKEGTIIKLKDSSKGFSAGNGKAVVSFGKGGFNNLPASNRISDLTINIGKGNSRAIGLLFSGANNSQIENINIISEDYSGRAGMVINAPPTLGWYNNINIVGFDYGVELSAYHASHVSFENLILDKQRKSALFLENGSASLKDIKITSDKGIAIIQNNAASLLNLDNVVAKCITRCVSGIDSLSGSIFGIDVKIYGYSSDVMLKGKKLKENITNRIFTVTNNGKFDVVTDKPLLKGVPLPPKFTSTDKSDWVRPIINGKQNTQSALQHALNSGKPIIFLPSAKYVVRKPIKVPCSVKRIVGMYTEIHADKALQPAAILVDEDCAEPLTIEDIKFTGPGKFIGHQSNRVLNLSGLMTMTQLYENLNPVKRKVLFLENVNGWGKGKKTCINQDVWARSINTESPAKYNFYLDNCSLWVLGFKTEKLNRGFVLRNGSNLMIQGGVINQNDQTRKLGTVSDAPFFDVENSSLMLSLVSTGPKKNNHGFLFLAKIIDGKKLNYIKWSEFEKRGVYGRDIIVPFFKFSR